MDLSDFKPEKLSTACNQAFKELGWFREVYMAARDEFAGPWHYNAPNAFSRWALDSINQDSTQMPVNLLDEILATYLPNLCGSEITAKITAKRPSLRGEAQLRELKINAELKAMGFPEIDRMVVQDLMLSGLGTYRVGLNQGTDQIHVNTRLASRLRPGQTFIKRISPMRIIRDPEAPTPGDERFYAEIVTVEKDWLLERNLVDNAVLEKLSSSSESRRLDDGSRSNADLNITETVEVIELTVFRNGKSWEMLLPLWDTGETDKFLIEPRESDACALGALEFVTLQNVNERVIGKSPAQTVMDLHLGLSRMGKKAIEQILVHKRNGVYSPDQSDFADELRTAAPEEWIAGDPSAIAQVVSGGLTNEMEAGYAWARSESNKASANVQQISGQGQGTKTATETSMLQGNSMVILQSSRERINGARCRVIQRLSDYEDTYQGPAQNLVHQMPNGDELEIVYDPSTRSGLWGDFNHDIAVTTTQAQEPNMRQRRIIEAMQIGPMFIQTVAQTGGNPSVAADTVADELDWPGFRDIYPTQMGQQMDMAMQQQQPQPPGPPTGITQMQGGKAKPVGNSQTTPVAQVRSDYSGSVPGQ